jgi:hypothetical protein
MLFSKSVSNIDRKPFKKKPTAKKRSKERGENIFLNVLKMGIPEKSYWPEAVTCFSSQGRSRTQGCS